MRIIVDAFGGDNAPLEIIKGSMLAVDEFGIDVILCGSEKEIMKCVNENKIELKHTQIYNTDAPAVEMSDDSKCVLREKANSSMGLGFSLLNSGEGDAFVSAGNTGAITVGATLITKRIKGVKRPCIASVMPSVNKPFLLLDCGANVECRPEFLSSAAFTCSISSVVKIPEWHLLITARRKQRARVLLKRLMRL